MAGLAWARLFPQVIRHCAQIKWKIIDIKHWFVLFSVRRGLAHGRGCAATRTEESIECNMHIVAWIMVSNYDATHTHKIGDKRERATKKPSSYSKQTLDGTQKRRQRQTPPKKHIYRLHGTDTVDGPWWERENAFGSVVANQIQYLNSNADREWSVRMPYSHAHEHIDTNEKALHMFQLR